MAVLHHLNILLHIGAGTLALLVGLGPLLAAKGGARHQQWGRWFLWLAVVVLVSASLGLAVFSFRPFLTVIVLLSVYQAYSGYRALRVQGSGPAWFDTGVALAFGLAGLAFLVVLPRIRLVWSPVVMYSTLGVLLATTAYDLSRPLWRAQWRRGAALYEHIWKLTSTYAALLSAFAGTVLAAYQPYSQFLPSVLGSVVGLGFLAATYRRRRGLAAGAAA